MTSSRSSRLATASLARARAVLSKLNSLLAWEASSRELGFDLGQPGQQGLLLRPQGLELAVGRLDHLLLRLEQLLLLLQDALGRLVLVQPVGQPGLDLIGGADDVPGQAIIALLDLVLSATIVSLLVIQAGLDLADLLLEPLGGDLGAGQRLLVLVERRLEAGDLARARSISNRGSIESLAVCRTLQNAVLT